MKLFEVIYKTTDGIVGISYDVLSSSEERIYNNFKNNVPECREILRVEEKKVIVI